MGIPTDDARLGGWIVGAVTGRRPAGVARDAVHPGSGARAVLVVVDRRFADRMQPDAELVARAAAVGSPAVMPLLDAGLLDDGTRWYVAPPAPAPVLDPAAGCSPRRAAAIVGSVASALAAVHAAGLVHGLVGPQAVVPAAGRHAGGAVGTTLLLDTGVAALLGDRAAELAAASGVLLPADRGPAADVHALGGLLLRMLTAAAPAGSALAALPPEVRALLAAMLHEDPAARPTAAGAARSLAALREGLLATGPIGLIGTGAGTGTGAPRRSPAAAPATPPPAATPAAVAPAAAAPAAARAVAHAVTVPPPRRAPVTTEVPEVVPRSLADTAPSLWTGSVAAQPGPTRRRGRTMLLVAGGVGLAGLLVGVVTQLPTGQQAGAAAAAADGGGAGVLTAQTDVARPASTTPAAATGSATPEHRATDHPSTSARPTGEVPSPLAATASTPTRAAAPSSTAPSSTAPSSRTAAPTPSRTTPTRSAAATSRPSAAPSSPSWQQTSAAPTSTPPTSSAPASPAPRPTTPAATATPTTDAPSETPTASQATTSPAAGPASSTATTEPAAG